MYEAILTAVEAYTSLVDFITRGKLEMILSSIGDVELLAARDALAKEDSSNKKKAPVRSAVTHLESAHVAYRSLYEDRSTAFRHASFVLAIHKDCYTMSMMAECYLYLKENRRAIEAADDAYRARKYYEEYKEWATKDGKGGQTGNLSTFDSGVFTTALNPAEWSKALKAKDLKIGMGQVEKFRNQVKRMARSSD